MNRNNYTRRDFLKTLGLGTAVIATNELHIRCRPLPSRPNIILIMADDMGFSDVGCYGGEIRTPHIDRLANGGIRFTHFYNTARCCPTRASLLTGLYPHQAGVGHMMSDRGLDGYRGDLNSHCLTIGEVLKNSGYSTYMSGKWHVTRFMKADGEKHNWPCQRGFDRFFGTISGSGSYYNPPTLTYENEFIESLPEGFYYTDAISNYAVKFISEHKQRQLNKPFFLYVAYTSPHWPLHALEEDIARYKGRYDIGWDALREQRHKRMIEMGIVDAKWKMTERDPRVLSWKEEESKKWQARRMEVYAAQIDRMDQGISRIISALEKTERLDNSLILFLADNGGCAEEFDKSNTWFLDYSPEKTRDGRLVKRGNFPSVMPGPEDTYQSYGIPWANASNTPFRLYKSWVHEGGVSTPLIVHWPSRIQARGELCHQPGHLIDIMPTLVDIAGADYPHERKDSEILPMEGKSLFPAFKNKPLDRGAIYFEHEGNRAIRRGKWKLVAATKKGPWELYDLEADRTEINNLAAKNPDLVDKMASMWQSWAERTNVLPWPDK